MLDRLFTEVVNVTKAFKVNALETFGPLAPVVTYAGYVMVSAIALMLLLAGRGFWSPPTPELKRLPARIAGAMIGITVVVIFIWVKGDPSARVLPLAAVLIGAGVLGATLYLFLRLILCFQCDHDSRTYVRGLWLTKNAKKRIDGELTGQETYDKAERPVNARVYFCTSRGDPYFVWSQASQAAAQVVLFLTYLIFIVPLVASVASASMALMQLDVKETAKDTQIDLPTDVLFDFDEATLRPAAANYLQKTADLLRERKVGAVRIDGHTDSRGDPKYNCDLSIRRAEEVRDWLATKGGLGTVAFRVQGYGRTQPVAPNKNPDGKDNPEGRQQNRRVTIVIDKAAKPTSRTPDCRA